MQISVFFSSRVSFFLNRYRSVCVGFFLHTVNTSLQKAYRIQRLRDDYDPIMNNAREVLTGKRSAVLGAEQRLRPQQKTTPLSFSPFKTSSRLCDGVSLIPGCWPAFSLNTRSSLRLGNTRKLPNTKFHTVCIQLAFVYSRSDVLAFSSQFANYFVYFLFKAMRFQGKHVIQCTLQENPHKKQQTNHKQTNKQKQQQQN